MMAKLFLGVARLGIVDSTAGLVSTGGQPLLGQPSSAQDLGGPPAFQSEPAWTAKLVFLQLPGMKPKTFAMRSGRPG